MREAKVVDRSLPIELSQINLAFYPGAHLMTVVACMPLAESGYRVESTTERERLLCQVVVDDVCDETGEVNEVIWSLLDDIWGMRTPRPGETYWASLQAKLSPDSVPLIGLSHEARQEDIVCAR